MTLEWLIRVLAVLAAAELMRGFFIDGKLTQTVAGSQAPSHPVHLAMQARPNTPHIRKTTASLYVSSVQVYS